MPSRTAKPASRKVNATISRMDAESSTINAKRGIFVPRSKEFYFHLVRRRGNGLVGGPTLVVRPIVRVALRIHGVGGAHPGQQVRTVSGRATVSAQDAFQ